MPTIVIVRHGVTDATGSRLGGRTPASLNDEGVAQVRATAERLATLPIAAVHTSPVVRTAETAEILAEPHGLVPREAPGLIEVDYGDWTDRPLAELRKEPLWSTVQRAPSRVRFPGGGTIREMHADAVDELERIAATHGPHDVVIAVSHADVIKAIVAHVAGVGLDGFQRFVIGPASATVVHLPPGGAPLLLATNSHGPVEVPRPSEDPDGAEGAEDAAGDADDPAGEPTTGAGAARPEVSGV